ncbi:MAG: hypothetical protein ACRDP8_00185, partial [Actinopolymorphaceae bacterium]
MKIARASQTMAKPARRTGGIGSANTSTPIRNCSVGAMYWMIPSVVRETRVAAAANSSSGMAVTTPAPASRT